MSEWSQRAAKVFCQHLHLASHLLILYAFHLHLVFNICFVLDLIGPATALLIFTVVQLKGTGVAKRGKKLRYLLLALLVVPVVTDHVFFFLEKDRADLACDDRILSMDNKLHRILYIPRISPAYWPCIIVSLRSALVYEERDLTSAPFLFMWPVLLGPAIFSYSSQIGSRYLKLCSPPVAAVVASFLLLFGLVLYGKPLTTYIFHFRAEARAYCAHERLRLWFGPKLSQLLRTFCLLRMVGLASMMIAYKAPVTWIGFVEELLASLCDTSLSALSLSCVLVALVDDAMAKVRAFLQERVVEKGLTGDLFAFSYSLAIQAETPFEDNYSRLYRLYQFLALYVLSRLFCVHQTISWRLQFMGANHIPFSVKHVRLLLGCSFLIMLTLGVLYYARRDETAWFMTAGCLSAELLLMGIITLATDILLSIKERRGGLWQGLEYCLQKARAVQNTLDSFFFVCFVWNCLYGLALLSPEIFCALDVRLFTYVNVWSQEHRCWDVRLGSQEARRRAVRLRNATSEELARSEDSCPICLGKMKAAVVTSCSHMFHEKCLRKWLRSRTYCPYCRS